ncbi:TetR/AcrR family transcriptional regulator [Phyllobacterium sp. A18/5-2]|uniref:TetR/AcrR family transcriptional regulator n=1 Tax=Phyllobacterium sp. A18/5-2 TaxID=2978392 RepID=UPI0021C81AA7|nr:TetR/AcrR family transcriptional regulator [Phyllobacterium sp. A18/5-2]UXN65231.1 TetR/AcrR family transcriptional regulator [Phyllobacterium sp. A18/5-2]
MTQRGRPRAFDRDAALARAMEVFWAKGYEGASMADLTAAMEINAPSLYAAFGSKAELFKDAVEVYRTRVGVQIWEALPEAATAREGFANFLKETALAYTHADEPHGCLIVLGALHGEQGSESVCALLRDRRLENVTHLRNRLERGIGEGELPATIDCQQVAEFYATVQHGMSITARDGASLEQLMKTADAAMAAWDTLTSQAA